MKHFFAGFFIFIAVILISQLFDFTVYTAEQRVIISEVAASAPSGEEWIEIVNISDEDIDLTGWIFWENGTNHRLSLPTSSILVAGGIAIIAQNADWFHSAYPNVSFVIDSSWSSLKESGEEIGLKNSAGETVELFTYPAATDNPIERTSSNHIATQYWVVGDTPGTWNYAQSPSFANNNAPTFIITEIYPAPNDGETERVLIQNTGGASTSPVTISVHDAARELAVTTSFFAGNQTITLSWSGARLNNTGDTVVLFANGVEVDRYEYMAADVTKGQAIILTGGGVAAPEKNTTLQTTSTIIISPSDVVINEFVSDPSDGKEEFVELYNNTGNTIDLNGWWIEDGSEAKTTLSGNILPYGFALITKIKGNLNNSGDDIRLFDVGEQLIDQVVYGDWQGAMVDVATDPYAMARRSDGLDTNSGNDFSITEVLTPNGTNQIYDPNQTVQEQVQSYAGLRINELLPDPEGDDAEGEFIELINTGSAVISLEGVRLRDQSGKRFNLVGLLRPGAIRAYKRAQTGIVLNNSNGDRVRLETAAGTVLDEVTYTSSKKAESYSLIDGIYQWTQKPTPNNVNVLKQKNHTPVAIIDAPTIVAPGTQVTFDASDSTDEDGDALTYAWRLGVVSSSAMVVEQTYDLPGVYEIHLTITDERGEEATAVHILTVQDGSTVITIDQQDLVSYVFLSEVQPNPEGSDSAEFVELYNPTDRTISVAGLKLDDEEGGSRAYTIPEGAEIMPGSYLVFGKQETKIAFNNTVDSVRLLRPDNTVIAETSYGAALEGASYAIIDDEWQWTGMVTPGGENKQAPLAIKGAQTVRVGVKHKPVYTVDIVDIRQFDPGDNVQTQGVVLVEPGVLGSQYIYIHNERGLQIYSHKSEFGTIKTGDRVTVKGELSEAYGEMRLKISGETDLIKVDHPGEPAPEVINVIDIGEEAEGGFVQVHGEVTERKTHYLYLDDGTAEVKVYMKQGTGIAAKQYDVGDLLSVTGIVSER